MVRKSCVVVLMMLLSQSFLLASWPHFQGPEGTGYSPETGLVRSFPESGPKILWRIDVEPGFGGAAIDGDEIFIMDREVGTQDMLKCLDLKTGKLKWQCVNKVPGRIDFNGSRCVPTVTKDRVYASGPFGQIYICDRNKKKFVKIIDMMKTFDVEEPPTWGYSHAPVVYKDKLIITPMGKKAGLAAIDKNTGKTIWTTPSFGELKYGSYMPVSLQTIAGVKGFLYIIEGHVLFIDPDTGKTIWDYEGYKNNIPIPYPTKISENKLFITGGYDSGSVMLEVLKKGTGYQFKEIFRFKERGSQIHPAILHNDLLFANFNTNENMDRNQHEGLVCLDLKGNTLWKTQKAPDVDKGNLIIADNMVIALAGETGELILAEATGEKYKQLAKVKVLNGEEEIWAPLALSNGMLILRDQEEMICIDMKKK